MSVQLLDKIRKINTLLHNNRTSKVVFSDICKIMVQCLDSNVLVISRKGKILGKGSCDTVPLLNEMLKGEIGSYADPVLNDRFLNVLSTKENVNLETLGFSPEIAAQYTALINPIEIAGKRLGTVFVYRNMPLFSIDDIIVGEYGTTVVGLEMMRSVHEEHAEASRKKQIVQSAFATLSFSEIEAVCAIIGELDGKEGRLIASKVAEKAGITRSVIVSALRKFESAGVLESRSGGMKGTYIKVLNEYLFEELEELKHNKM